MSGHSKWSSIKHQKAVTDAKRSSSFTKLANGITVAARAGADPTMNFTLRLAIDRAKSANMPKDNIERAVQRGSGSAGASVEEILYEAYGPSGTAILIEVATDNKNRAIGEIKAVLNKLGAKLAESGSVSYLFEKKGQIIVKTDDPEAEMKIIDSGADDYENTDGSYFVYSNPKRLDTVKSALESAGLKVEDYALIWQPKTTVELDEVATTKVMRILETLDNLEDVSGVSSNFS